VVGEKEHEKWRAGVVLRMQVLACNWRDGGDTVLSQVLAS
jgi:hypothetical protein